jgi:hypothetical protein
MKIKIIQDTAPNLVMQDIAELFGVSRASIYRAFDRYGVDLNRGGESEQTVSPYFIDRAVVYVPAANAALQNLPIPNDISEVHRELLVALIDEVQRLNQIVENLSVRVDSLSGDYDDLKLNIENAIPLWTRAWETFVLKAAESTGTNLGRGALFAAGLVAGHLYRQFVL